MRYILTLVLTVAVLVPSWGWAAYQNPTVISNERQNDGYVKLRFRYVGNAGEPTVERDYLVQHHSTATALRNWIDDTINELDLLHTATSLPALQPGQTIPRLARTPRALTLKEAWIADFTWYLQIKDAATNIPVLAAPIAAMEADLNTRYQAGYLDR